MFKCHECGSTFEEPKHYTERHGLDSPPYEEYNACPLCAGSYDDAEQCTVCGECFLPEEDIKFGYCPKCARDLYTDALGLEFVKQKRTFERYEYSDDYATKTLVAMVQYDFKQEFIERVHDIADINISGDKEQILDVMMGDFETAMALEKELGRHAMSDKLKEFALDDFDYWVEFLKERGE